MVLALRVVRGLGHRPHRVGRPAVARPDGVRRHRRAERGGVRARRHVRHRLARRPRDPPGAACRKVPFVLALLLGATVALSRAPWSVGFGALRGQGSAARRSARSRSRSPRRRTSSPGRSSPARSTPRPCSSRAANLGPVDLAHLNRSYYYFTLAALVVVLLVVGHLRRTGIGRTIIGVRENEPAASALTVSPGAAKLTAFAVGGLRRRPRRRDPRRARGDDRVLRALLPGRGLAAARRDGGHRRARQPRGRGGRRAVGRRAARVLARTTRRVPLLHVEHRAADHPAVHPRRVHPDRVLVPRA